MWQHGLSFAPYGTTGYLLRSRDNGVCSPKGDKTSYLSKTLQVFIKSIAGERRTTSGDFSVVLDSPAESLTDKIKQASNEDLRYHTSPRS